MESKFFAPVLRRWGCYLEGRFVLGRHTVQSVSRSFGATHCIHLQDPSSSKHKLYSNIPDGSFSTYSQPCITYIFTNSFIHSSLSNNVSTALPNRIMAVSDELVAMWKLLRQPSTQRTRGRSMTRNPATSIILGVLSSGIQRREVRLKSTDVLEKDDSAILHFDREDGGDLLL
jgi:hypothetical protein